MTIAPRLAVLFAALALIPVLAGPGHAGEAGQPIRIGVAMPLSGPLAQLGRETLAGADIARQMVNERGGVSGRPVEFLSVNTPQTQDARAEVERLVTGNGVKVVIGNYGSSLSIASVGATRRNGAFYWEIISGALDIVNVGKPHVVKASWDYQLASEVFVTAVKELFAPKLGKPLGEIVVAIVHEDSAFGTEVGEYLPPVLARERIKLGEKLSYNPSQTTDFTPMIARLRNTRPDVVLIAAYLHDGVLFWRQASALGFTPAVLVGLGGISQPDFGRTLGDVATGVSTLQVSATVKEAALSPEARARRTEFAQRFEKTIGRGPGTHAVSGFDNTWVLLTEVLPKAKSLAPDDLREAALAVDIPVGGLVGGGGFKVSGLNDPFPLRNVRPLLVINQWQGGRQRTVFPASFAEAPLIAPIGGR